MCVVCRLRVKADSNTHNYVRYLAFPIKIVNIMIWYAKHIIWNVPNDLAVNFRRQS